MLPDWPRALGQPMVSGLLKAEPKDFVVEEVFDVEFSNDGEFDWLWIEKCGDNTEYVAKQLARLAGVPRRVNERAKEILAQLEEEHLNQAGRSKTARRKKKPAADPFQLTLFGYEDHPLLDKIRQLNLDVTSPVEAFQQIQQWQAELSDEPQVKPR